MVEHSLAKADTGVRFPSFAPLVHEGLLKKAFFHILRDRVRQGKNDSCTDLERELSQRG